MRIGQFSETFYPIVDGVGRVVYNYANTLGAGGDECYVVTPQVDTGYRGCWPFEMVDYAASPVIAAPQYRSGIAVLDRHYVERMDNIKLDIAHAHTPFFAGQEALRQCSKQNIPLIGTFHSKYYDDFYKATHAKLIANIGVKLVVDFYDKCDEVWAVSESSAVVLRDYGYTGNIIIMENGTEFRPVLEQDKLAAAARFGIDLKHPVFLFVGQINWKKGIMRLLEAASYLKLQNERFSLVLAGQGPDEEAIRKKARELDVEDRVIFTGHIADTHMLDGLYQCATLFTFPSLYDTFSLVMREAAAMYTPSVVTEGGAASEPIIHGENGLLCKDDGTELGKLLLRYMHDDEAVRRMGVNAHDSIPKPWQEVIARARRRYQALSESSGSEEMTARHAQIKEKLMEWSERLAEYFNIKL